MRNVLATATTVFLVIAFASVGFSEIQDGPYLQNVTSTGVTVCFVSTDPDATVQYGLDDSYGSEASSDTNPLFQVRIDGLLPGTVYHYRVSSGAGFTVDKIFTTAVNPGTPFLFCAYGDNRNPSGQTEAVANGMAAEVPDFVINTGDLVLFDEMFGIEFITEWQVFFRRTGALISQSPLFAIRGNHDDDTDLFEFYMDNPTANSGSEHYYSFDYGNAHFLALDSTLEECSGAQLAFVELDLAAHAGSGPLFVFFHHPPFSNGTHGGSQSTHDCWAPLFQEYGVDMVFGGHDHLYTRYGTYPVGSPISGINGVTYIVTGGGGAPLYPPNDLNQAPIAVTQMVYHYLVLHVSGNIIDVTMRRVDGTEGDHFTVDAAANDGLFDRDDPLPPKGDGGPAVPCGTIPGSMDSQSTSERAAIAIYLLPVLFLLSMKGFLLRRARV